MKEQMGICGYRCDLCTVHKDNLERVGKEKVKADFIKYFNHELEMENIEGCLGCPADGDENCSVKSCAKEKGVAKRGLCPEYPCDKVQEKMNVIEKYFDDVTALAKEDQRLYVEPYRNKERLEKKKNDNRSDK